ncbi:MAG: hypothetical protein RL557_220 [archaeon]|jgi:O-antigen/teichoic acid export membrane protein
MKDTVTEDIALGGFWNFLLTFFARIGSFFFVFVVAKYLLPENFGIYSLAVSIALIILITIDAGINQSLLKYVSEALNKKNKKLATANFRYLFKVKLIVTFSVGIFLIIFSYPLANNIFHKPQLFLPLIFSSFFILVNSIGNFYSSYFYVIRQLKYITYKQIIFEVLRIFGVLGMFLIVSRQHYIIGTFGVLIISMTIAILFLFYHLRTISPFLFEESTTVVDAPQMLKFSLLYSVIGSLLILFGYIDMIMIGIFLEASYVGYYTIALAFMTGIWGFLNLSHILLPIFTKLDDIQIHREFNRLFQYISILAVPAIFGILALGKYFLIFIDARYLPAEMPLYILSVLVFIVPLIETLTPLFSARDKLKIIAYGVIIAMIVNILLNYFLITSLLRISESMAMGGAALATVVSQLFYLFILVFYSKKFFNVRLQLSRIIKPLLASLIMFFPLLYINTFVEDFTLFLGIAEIILGFALYFLSLFLIKGIDKVDVILFKDTFKKFFKVNKK